MSTKGKNLVISTFTHLNKNQDQRLKLLESFINKVLEVNQRKAIQRDPPLKMKEVLDIGKEFLEGATEYSSAPGPSRSPAPSRNAPGGRGFRGNQLHSTGGYQGNSFKDRRNFNDGRESLENMTKRLLAGHKVRGMEYCVNYNLSDRTGESRCKDKKCPRAHNCGFIPRGGNVPCGKNHPKYQHFKN